jgi:hypothetical protein
MNLVLLLYVNPNMIKTQCTIEYIIQYKHMCEICLYCQLLANQHTNIGPALIALKSGHVNKAYCHVSYFQ